LPLLLLQDDASDFFGEEFVKSFLPAPGNDRYAKLWCTRHGDAVQLEGAGATVKLLFIRRWGRW
jgi:hypothetical protein